MIRSIIQVIFFKIQPNMSEQEKKLQRTNLHANTYIPSGVGLIPQFKKILMYSVNDELSANLLFFFLFSLTFVFL